MADTCTPTGNEMARKSLSRLEFADEILRAAASPERIGAVVTAVVRDRLDIGPIGFGPAGLLTARAAGRTDHAMVEPDPNDHCRLILRIPLLLRIDAGLGKLEARFVAGVDLRTELDLVLSHPCALLVRLHPVRPADVAVRVRGIDLLGRAAVLVAPIARLVSIQVADHTNTVFTDPQLTQLTRIDVVQLIDRAWESGLLLPPVEPEKTA
ncbi:hypothetical protein [Nocardia yamanashiensis]|uniref:hypothetical protein n=1 Tax=Nocardia yamanashiensis TaxID=209247 RepID=UPI00083632BB|nr:hypothetical protein [Nocardia yamanashiensis]